MKIFHSVAKPHAGADEKHEINFHWPNDTELITEDSYGIPYLRPQDQDYRVSK